MEEFDQLIAAALEQTRVVRPPRQHLATFGSTNLRYYMVTEPVYEEAALPRSGGAEAVLRQGTIIAKRPEVVTPGYMLRLQGFGDEARRSMELLAMRLGYNAPGLLYTYRNEPGELSIVSGNPDGVADNVRDDLDGRSEDLAVVIRGADMLWDVSLLKFIYEFTAASAASNAGDLSARSLLDPDPQAGIPRAGIVRIEGMFREVEAGGLEPAVLKQELDRWDVFDRYQDRFLGLFRRRR